METFDNGGHLYDAKFKSHMWRIPYVYLVRITQETMDQFPDDYGKYKGKVFALQGRVHQMVGHVLLFDIDSNTTIIVHDHEIELVPEEEL